MRRCTPSDEDFRKEGKLAVLIIALKGDHYGCKNGTTVRVCGGDDYCNSAFAAAGGPFWPILVLLVVALGNYL